MTTICNSTDKYIVLRDFNMNILDNSNRHVASIFDSLIDHVYVNNHSLQKVRVEKVLIFLIKKQSNLNLHRVKFISSWITEVP